MIKMLVCDFDGTISGGCSLGIAKFTQSISQQLALNFVVATGRTFASIKQALASGCFPKPSTIVSDVGTRIQHAEEEKLDSIWSSHVKSNWQREKVLHTIRPFSFLSQGTDEHQSQYKITLEGKLKPAEVARLRRALTAAKLEVDLTYSHDWFLDITPKGVCKAAAIRYLLQKYKLKPEEVCVAGDSANDSSMLSIEGIKGILVANHYPEVSHLSNATHIYTSKATHAKGVLEGLRYWQELAKS